MDGLQQGPIDHGTIESGNWIEEAKAAIQERIAKYENELGFTVLAVVKNLREKYAEQLQSKTAEKEEINIKLSGNLDDNERKDLEARIPKLEEEMSMLEMKISNEVSKLSQWREENTRRRHNYIPFIFNFLRVLALKNKLQPLLEKAKEKQSS